MKTYPQTLAIWLIGLLCGFILLPVSATESLQETNAQAVTLQKPCDGTVECTESAESLPAGTTIHRAKGGPRPPARPPARPKPAAKAPAGKAKVPAGKAKVPAGKAKTPAGKPKTPVGKAKTPVGKAKVPASKASAPAGKGKTPPGKAKTPTGKPKTPAGTAKTPAGKSKTLTRPKGTPRIGHTTPWGKMTHTQQRAFQHSYSRHAAELGLPKWRQKNAEAHRKQFNNVVGHIRSAGQYQGIKKKPVNGKSTNVHYFQYAFHGKNYYYYETLGGQFVSAGRAR